MSFKTNSQTIVESVSTKNNIPALSDSLIEKSVEDSSETFGMYTPGAGFKLAYKEFGNLTFRKLKN